MLRKDFQSVVSNIIVFKIIYHYTVFSFIRQLLSQCVNFLNQIKLEMVEVPVNCTLRLWKCVTLSLIHETDSAIRFNLLNCYVCCQCNSVTNTANKYYKNHILNTHQAQSFQILKIIEENYDLWTIFSKVILYLSA